MAVSGMPVVPNCPTDPAVWAPGRLKLAHGGKLGSHYQPETFVMAEAAT